MEEKNNIIKEYINKRVEELTRESMFVPKESIEKLNLAFMNRPDDINVIKTKIDAIFDNSIKVYKDNLEKIGLPYKDVFEVYKKIQKLNKTTAKLYLAGGIIPYVLLNTDSERKHSNLNLLMNKKDAKMIREVFRKKDLYDPKRDSLTYTINDIDYGFEVIVDKVKVDIAVFEENPDGITEYSFDCRNRIGRIKKLSTKLNEYIVPYVSSDNKKYMTLSLECVVADKVILGRDKDKQDIEKIKECNGISTEKIKKLPLPIVKEVKLVGDNLEFTSTMPRIKLDIPKKSSRSGFVNIATILLLLAIVTCFILGGK